MTNCLDLTFTVDQATDLARHFLGREWFAWTMNGACILGVPRDGARHANTTWRDAFRMAGVKLPSRPRFASVGRRVMRENEAIANCVSNSTAERIANALNVYAPDRRGT